MKSFRFRRAPQRRTVLVVEDQRPVREMFATALRLAGYVVIAVEDAPSAMPHLQGHLDAIVLDLSLPGVSGEAFLQDLRSGGQTQIPVIVVTGSEVDSVPGAYAVLRKPLSLHTLVAFVGAALAPKNEASTGLRE
jgi:DNA-binding response OmpR family regulator